jgi:hypothetical protein
MLLTFTPQEVQDALLGSPVNDVPTLQDERHTAAGG